MILALALLGLLIATLPLSAEDRGSIAPADLAATLASDNAPLLLDVRTPEEFARGHVPGALLIPIQELEERLHQIAAYRERGVVAYCESGGRANRALDILAGAGFQNLALLEGSMSRWRDENRSVKQVEATD